MSFVEHLTSSNPFTDVYGTGRSLLALSTLLTLALNPNLFPIGAVIYEGGDPAFAWNLFVLAESPGLGRLIAVLLLAVVVSGWRPRVTGILHVWVTLSLTHTPAIMDGGEHVAQALSLLLLPLTLLDDRRWHWSKPSERSPTVRAAGQVFLIGIRVQVCLIYLEAFVAKFSVAEWRDGTALYYWVANPIVGSGPVVKALLEPLLSNAVLLPLLTWSVLALEFGLAAALFAEQRFRRALLVAGLAFHIGIAFLHGISSFALIMIGALILYLRRPDATFDWATRVHALRTQMTRGDEAKA